MPNFYYPNQHIYTKSEAMIIFEFCFLVDQEVNIGKALTLEQALEKHVPVNLRESVRAEYQRWHSPKEK